MLKLIPENSAALVTFFFLNITLENELFLILGSVLRVTRLFCVCVQFSSIPSITGWQKHIISIENLQWIIIIQDINCI